MADEGKEWSWILGVATAVFTVWKFVLGGGKQKVATENKKTDAEADNLRLEGNLKSEEYYKRESTEQRQIIETLTEKLRESEKRELNLQRERDDYKRKCTILSMRLDATKKS